MYKILEQWLRTDLRYLLRGGIWLWFAQAASFFATFGLVWVLANYVSKEIYGQYRFFITVAAIAALTALPGINMALARAVAQGSSGSVRSAVRHKIVWGLWGSAGCLAAAAYYSHMGNSTLMWSCLIISAAVPFLDTFGVFGSYLQGHKDFKLQSILYIIQRLFITALLAMVAWFIPSAFWLLFAYLTSTIFFQYFSYSRSLAAHPPDDTKTAPILSYGKHLSVISILRVGSQQIDKIFLWYLIGPAAVANYTIAVAVPNEIASAASQVNSLAFPKMAANSKRVLKETLFRKYLFYLAALFPITIAYAFSAELFFSIFFPQYIASAGLSAVAIVLVLFAPNGLLYQYFIVTENKRVQYFTSILEPIVLLSLFVVCIPWLGIYGAVLAFIIRNIVSVLALSYFFFTDSAEELDS